MRKQKKILYSLIVLLVIGLGSGASLGIDKAKYTVQEKAGKFEIRQYDPQVIAETVVDADFADAGNVAFRRLFNYISGNNRSKASISMTAPVSQKADSEKIAMTAPVNQHESGGKYVVSFLMPAKYTLANIPEPLDKQVVIRAVRPGKVAALRYSGTWSQKRYEVQKERLEGFIQKKGLRMTGDAVFARYDPPFQLWFLRRNEVLIPVE